MPNGGQNITVGLPDGRTVAVNGVPPGATKEQIFGHLMEKRPELFAQPPQPPKPPEMQEMMSGKSLVREGPGVVGGIAGAMGGTALEPGAGTVAGAGLGAAAGTSAGQYLTRKIYGEEEAPAPGSKAGVKEAAGSFLAGAAGEAVGGVALSKGGKVLENIALFKKAGEFGDALEGLKAAATRGFSKRGIEAGVLAERKNLGDELGTALKAAKGQDIDVGQAFASMRQQLRQQAQSGVPAVRQRALEDMIQLEDMYRKAWTRAGLGANKFKLSPEEAWNFMRQFRSAYSKSARLNETAVDMARDMYRALHEELGNQVPQAKSILSKMADNHAAESALKAYRPGRAASAAAWAAKHPYQTTAYSAPLTVAAPMAGERIAGYAAERAIVPYTH